MAPRLPSLPPSPDTIARAIAAYRRVLTAPPTSPLEATWRPAPPPGQGWRVLVGLVLGAGAVLLLRALMT